jgi:hypothetical protein
MKGQFDQALAEAFYFEEADVLANRAGRMSPRQRDGFAAGADQNRKSGSVLMKFMAVASLASVSFFAFANSKSKGETDLMAVIIPLGVSAVLLVLVGVIARRKTNRLADRMAQGAPVQVVDGRLEVDRDPARWWETSTRVLGWQVSIGEVGFRLLPDQAEAFEDGEQYRIYYCDFQMARLIFLTAERAN